MRISLLLIITLLNASLVLAACGQASPTPAEVDMILTEGIGTMVASFFGTQTAMFTPPSPVPPATATSPSTPTRIIPTVATSSPTLAFFFSVTPGTVTPSLTRGATGTLATTTIDPALLGFGCNNLAFIRDVSIPAGTVLQPGQNFTKTWKVQNIGTCPWMYQYRLVLLSGNDFSAGPTKLDRVVKVNDWAEVSVNMDAPMESGTYTNYWRMADSSGQPFGATLAASFKVQVSPTAAPPTAVPPTAVPPTETLAPSSTPTDTPAP
jgi:hypothetical protein